MFVFNCDLFMLQVTPACNLNPCCAWVDLELYQVPVGNLFVLIFWSSDLHFSQIHFLIHPSRMQLTHWCICSTAQFWRALFPFTSIMSKWSSNLIEVHELRELASFKFGCRKDSSLIERSVNSFHAIEACFWLFASVNFCYVRMGPLVMCGWGR